MFYSGVMHSAPETVDVTTAEDAVLRLTMAVGRRFRSRLDGDSVDPAQASLLYTLKIHGSMRLGDLAEAMKLDASTVSRHVQQLSDRGQIEREHDPEDARARIIVLTDAGRTSLKHTFDQRRAIIAEAMTDWTDTEREDLRDVLVRLTSLLPDH
jgi:DNA-binding MarR family transcriptional regulator